MSNVQSFSGDALRDLTDEIGVYALCDLDGVPIYVGQSVDGIRSRVRRHLTSARSDVIANRQVDVWEIAYVWAWPVKHVSEIARLEAHLFNEFDPCVRLMNGKGMLVPDQPVDVPEKQVIQVIEEDERINRQDPALRLPRQIMQYNLLVDYILNVKDAAHLKRSLDAHFERLVKYHRTFL
ncbi:hypothetical protein ACSSV8_001550 [Roseovarius sp. MBR-79]